MQKINPDDIDALLPQTQCGLCGYGGCMPYAEALIYEGAAINLCPPGGVKVLKQLGEILQQDIHPFVSEMELKQKPLMQAIIREDECIGCTKCIQACPVDAILGSAKAMHTVIASECTGCELCIAPCPVDCINMIETEETLNPEKSQQFRIRYETRNNRLKQENKAKKELQQKNSINNRLQYIDAAIARSKAKKINSF